MQTTPRHRTVGHLQSLYAVAVGFTLATAVAGLIDQTQPIPVTLSVVPFFVAYLVTLVPMYHGALRHLDMTYIESQQDEPKSGALLADWAFLFIESCFLLALAIFIKSPSQFFYAFIVFLMFDAIWAFFAHLAFSPKTKKMSAEVKWAIINAITSVVLVIVAVFLHAIDSPDKPVDSYRWIIVLLFAIARTVVDYKWCWDVYFPGHSAAE